MIRVIHLSIVLILAALLSGCGSYIVSAAKLKELHQNDIIQTGHYSDKDFHLSLIDGDGPSGKICLSVEDDRAIGSVHFVPTQTGIISIASNLSLEEEGVWTLVQGELIFYLKKEAQNILLYDPITQAHAAGKDVPFIVKCKAEYSGTQASLSNYHMQSYCLSNSADTKDIARWFDVSPGG